jgi:hypothetical protein
MKQIALAMLCFIFSGCASKVAVHPGATSLDSYAYDVLLVEQDAINAAKDAYTAGNLPASAHDPMNAAIKQYDATNQIWQAYHAAGGTGDATALNTALAALNAAVNTLQGILGKPAVTLPGKPISNLRRPYGYAYS